LIGLSLKLIGLSFDGDEFSKFERIDLFLTMRDFLACNFLYSVHRIKPNTHVVKRQSLCFVVFQLPKMTGSHWITMDHTGSHSFTLCVFEGRNQMQL
jgi:hypothetical protein